MVYEPCLEGGLAQLMYVSVWSLSVRVTVAWCIIDLDKHWLTSVKLCLLPQLQAFRLVLTVGLFPVCLVCTSS